MSEEKKKPLSVDIYTTVRERILSWEYPPNHHLTEAALQSEFGVSRVPVREALHMLEEHDLVERIPYQGCRVRQPDLKQVHELYDMRLAIELHVVEQLAEKGIDDSVWRDLHETWIQLYETANEGDSTQEVPLATYDNDFHETLARATGNKILLNYFLEINERLAFVRKVDITDLERLKSTCQQHLPVLEHIRNGNAPAAREMMRLNIETGRSNVESAIKAVLVKAFSASS